jgi:2,3-bisphosphoglycerate-independent phosphoglycerate mutase
MAMTYKIPMAERRRQRLAVLCILDGWGASTERENNAISQAQTPVWDALLARFPHAHLDASEHHVGLPDGQMGNSEVGHMNLGAGRIVPQDLPRIDAAIETHALASNVALQDFIARLRASGGTAHILGLVSPGGVHAHQDHISALANILHEASIVVAVHAFLDGRDTPPKSALGYVADLCAAAPTARIATVSGRYYAMDRDHRFERTALAYAALADGSGEKATTAEAAITSAYATEKTDEFVRPTIIADYAGMQDGDGLLMANFRSDRARQILTTLLEPGFTDFPRKRIMQFSATVGMVEYSRKLNGHMGTLFPPQILTNTLGDIVATAGLRQLRIAETEKYAHVTFFFNGGDEQELPGEERILVPSPKVATYDLAPEMSAPELTDRLVDATASGRFDLIVVNYANTDMVGHTGNLKAAIHAVESVDTCLGRLVQAVDDADGILLITADHGNAEAMGNPTTGQAHTAHTCNPVPIVLATDLKEVKEIENGALADVAPTLLDLMGLPQPQEMTGHTLIARSRDHRAVG